MLIRKLFADAISVLDSGKINELEVHGDLVTNGDKAVVFHVNGGVVKKFNLQGKILANGNEAQQVLVENNGTAGTEALGTTSANNY